MIQHSKAAQHAIAAISRLAEVHADAKVWLSAADIARDRDLRKPAAAKVLAVLVRENLVSAAPGPGGGYRLSRHPASLSLWDVISLFDPPSSVACPFGPNWCGKQQCCPMHDSMLAMRSVVESYFRATTFEVFTRQPRPERMPDTPPHLGTRKP